VGDSRIGFRCRKLLRSSILKGSVTDMKVSPHIMDNADEKIAAVKIAIGGGGALIYGYTLNEWVAVITIVYMVLQIILLLPKYYEIMHRTYRRWRSKTP